MQKKIIALAIAAAFAAPVAMAETANVNVYGSIDGGLRSDTGAGKTMNTFGSGTYNSNRWGIKGSEDLGDGMKANFGLEGSFLTGTGEVGSTSSTATTNTATNSNTDLFARNATVGVSGSFGSVDLGRQYSVAFKTVGLYDPFGFKFIKIAGGESAAMVTRYNNDVSYTGKFGDVTVMAEHNVPATGDDSSSTTAAGVGFSSGPITVGGAYSATKAVVGSIADTKYYTVGAAFNFGDGKVSVGHSNNTVAAAVSGGNDTVTKQTFIGASYNVTSKVGVTAAVYKKVVTVAADVTDTKMMLAATYALSKRTNFYAEIDKNSNDTAGTTTDTNGYSLGLATTF